MNKLQSIPWLLKIALKNIKIKLLLLAGLKVDNKYKYRLFLKITDACNYQCLTCGNWKTNQNKWLSKADQEIILNKYSNQLFFLTITGGEPFLNADYLIDFIKSIKNRNPDLRYISINTNCSHPKKIQVVISELINSFPDIKFYIGLHFILNEQWGLKKTGIKTSFENYKKTISILDDIAKNHSGNLIYYKVATISSQKDAMRIKKEINRIKGDLWLNFAQIDSFYNNESNNQIREMSDEKKINLIDSFLERRSSFLNKRYLKGLRKTIQRGRSQKCYAGINRSFINEDGEQFICFKGLKNRDDMSPSKCKSCWSSCEVNFDFLPSFFIPSIFNRKYK